ncbi:MAG: tetratricopeptide repeat protein [Saprospiraceae bacterium]|nr:tetratricopeptide repeat protein [Saprospiraceae bacterium]
MKKAFCLLIAFSTLILISTAQTNPSNLKNPGTRITKNFNSDWINSLVKTQVLSPQFFEKIETIYSQLQSNESSDLTSSSEENLEITENQELMSGQIYRQASLLIENFEFEKAHRLLGKHVISKPEDDLARYLLAITQLSRGLYAAAASNFSKVNLHLAQKDNLILNTFKDDVRFYFAISITMVPGGKPIAKTLFNQLNYEGSTYQSICKEMSELL